MPNFTDTHPDYSDSYESMLDDLDQPETVRLSDWEIDFLDKMVRLNAAGKTLTDSQAAKIREMFDDHCS